MPGCFGAEHPNLPRIYEYGRRRLPGASRKGLLREPGQLVEALPLRIHHIILGLRQIRRHELVYQFGGTGEVFGGQLDHNMPVHALGACSSLGWAQGYGAAYAD